MSRVSIDDAPVARAVRELLQGAGRLIFQADGRAVTAADVNEQLLELTGEHITVKDFRTPG